MDKILRGEPKSRFFSNSDENQKLAPIKKMLSVKERLNNILYNNSTSSQLNKYFMEANVDILKKIVTNKLNKEPLEIISTPKRDRMKYLQEIMKDCINNFQSLSKNYFKQVGDEYIKTEFGELASDNTIKELEKKAKTNLRLSQSLNHTKLENMEKEGKGDNELKVSSKLGRRRNSVLQRSSINPFNITLLKKPFQEKPPENPLADIKSQISNIEEFIRSFIKSEEEIMARQQDFSRLDDEKKALQTKIQNLRHQIVG